MKNQRNRFLFLFSRRKKLGEGERLANLYGKCKHANCAIKNCAVEVKLAA